MKKPTFLTCDEQLNLFESRGLTIKKTDKNHASKLYFINYYKIKEFAKPFESYLMDGTIRYENITFDEVITRFYQDKNLRMNLLHAIEKIEIALKTRIAYILGQKYGPFGYLEFKNWVNKEKFSKYQVEKEQIRLKNKLFQSLEYTRINDFKKKNNLDVDGFPTVWLAIDLLTFGEILNILKIMSNKNLDILASDFGCEKKELVSWVGCLKFVRDACAHNSNIIDLNLKTKPKLRQDWIPYLHKNNDKISSKLAVIILITLTLVNVINPNYSWKMIKKNLNTLISRDDKKAEMLGFNSARSVNKILALIRKI